VGGATCGSKPTCKPTETAGAPTRKPMILRRICIQVPMYSLSIQAYLGTFQVHQYISMFASTTYKDLPVVPSRLTYLPAYTRPTFRPMANLVTDKRRKPRVLQVPPYRRNVTLGSSTLCPKPEQPS